MKLNSIYKIRIFKKKQASIIGKYVIIGANKANELFNFTKILGYNNLSDLSKYHIYDNH